MTRFQGWRPLVAILSVLTMVSAAAAQNTRPLSKTDGYAGQEMRGIYRQDIGQGYSGESLNRLALRNAMSNVPNVGQTTAMPAPRLSAPVGGPLNKPFAGYSPDPTVSPYLNLFREDFDGSSDFNYQTLVRPQLEQQRFQRAQQQQNLIVGQRLQQLSAQPDYNPQGSETQLPTGHQTVFMYLGRYYPALNARRGR